nr:H-NS histone family protein [Burkholderia cepacia]
MKPSLSERYTTLGQIREAVATFQFTENEIFGRSMSPKRVVFAKYRNPETGETWSGRGRAPVWIAVQNRKQFRIRD